MTTAQIRSRLRSVPGVARLRAYAEHAFAPNLRLDVHGLRQDVDRVDSAHEELRHVVDELSAGQRRDCQDLKALRAEVERLQAEHEALRRAVDGLSERIGPVLDSVLSTNEIARLARREMDALRDLVAASVGSEDRPPNGS